MRLLLHIERQVHGILNEGNLGRRFETAQVSDDLPAILQSFGAEFRSERVIKKSGRLSSSASEPA